MDKADKPRFKKKSFLRTEALIPFALFLALVLVYFTLFFDGHLRRGLEKGLTYANGAEVNIAAVSTSFWRASFAMTGVQVTDPSEPIKNRLKFERMECRLLWDGLLRSKLVVEVASVLGIEVGSPRQTPGKVLPPAPPSSTDGPGAGLLAKARAQVSKVALEDVGKILGGVDPTQGLKDLSGLKSMAYIESLNRDLSQKQSQWMGALGNIPGEKDFGALQSRVNAINVEGIKSPAEVPARLEAVKQVLKEADEKRAAVAMMGTGLAEDIGGFSKGFAEIDKLVDADRKELESRLKIPSFDPRSIAERLFGDSFSNRLGQIEHYVALARKYIPSGSASASKSARPKPQKLQRAKGHLYAFGSPKAYPLFWMKKMAISGHGRDNRGDLEGELLDLASDQGLTGVPTVLHINGDFPQNEVHGVEMTLTLDHRKEVPMEKLVLSANTIGIERMMLADSSDLKFGFKKATGEVDVQALIHGDQFQLKIDNKFKKPEYLVQALSPLLQSILERATQELPIVTVLAGAEGTWSQPKFVLESNLASAMEKSLGKEVQEKLAQARKKLEGLIQAQIAKPKQELQGRFEAEKAKLLGLIDGRKKQAEALQSQGQAKIAALNKKAQGAAGQAAQQKVGDLLKKKLPF